MKRILCARNVRLVACGMVVSLGVALLLASSSGLSVRANQRPLIAAPGYLGVTFVNLNVYVAALRGQPRREGALVTAVAPNSPAEQAGLRPGDLIVGLDDQIVGDQRSLLEGLLSRRAGEQVAVTLARDDGYVTIPITLTRR